MSDEGSRRGGEGTSGARLEQLVTTTQDAVLFIDRLGTIVLANPATYRIFGYEDGELTGRDVRLLMSEPYASEHREYVARYEATGEKRAIGRIRQVSARRKNGEEFPIELSVTQLAEEGDGARYGAFIRDVSEKARIQRQLVERERFATLGTTASMLVHEIGNPLNNMALQLELLRRKVTRQDGSDDAGAKVDACLQEVQRLSRLVQEFRLLSGRRRLARRVVAPTPLLENVPVTMANLGPAVTLERRFDDDRARVFADPDKLQQVFLNLFQNALEAMPEGGTLTLRTSADEHDWIGEVGDTGGGIPDGLDVFEPFVTTKEEGTGLGLAICSQIVAEHGGTLTYRTRAGEGTVFRLTLPRASDEASGRG